MQIHEEIVPCSLYLVATPIGNLADISLRALHVLNKVHLIAAEDTRTTSILLKKYQISNQMTSFNAVNQKKKIPGLIQNLKSDKSVALVSDAGTPGINDPAYNLVCACIEEGIRVIPIPGASAFIAALTASGLPTNRFVFEGFLPVKKGRQTRLKELSAEKRTIVLYESPHRIQKTVDQLLQFSDNRACVMAREISKIYEEFFRGSLSELAEYLKTKKIKGEIVLVVKGNDQ